MADVRKRYLIVIESGDRNYSAFSPDIPGCIATGRSIDETIANMKTALEFHLEGMVENGEEVPQPSPLSYYVEKADEVTGEDIIAHIILNTPQPALA